MTDEDLTRIVNIIDKNQKPVYKDLKVWIPIVTIISGFVIMVYLNDYKIEDLLTKADRLETNVKEIDTKVQNVNLQMTGLKSDIRYTKEELVEQKQDIREIKSRL